MSGYPTITLSVPDVSCGHCVVTISQALKGLDGVSGANVDLKQKHATVHVADDQALTRVLARLDEEGYPATVVGR